MSRAEPWRVVPRTPAARAAVVTLVTVAAVLAVYWRARTGDFLWDDDAHITTNPTIIGPLGLKEIWTTAAANYFPLTMTSFWLGHAWWGLAPEPYHVVSILFHAGSAWLLWRVLRRLAIPGAWLGAMLWALHPVQVESVAWICELKNTQSGFFYLLAILLFLRWLQRPGALTVGADYLLAIGAALAALLSKTSTVMLPVVLGLVAWWLGRRRWREGGWLIPFMAISATAGGWTIWEQRVHSMASGAEWSQTLPERLIIAGRAPWFYLEKILWPHPLIFIYPRWSIDAGHWVEWVPLAGAMVLSGLAWHYHRRVRGIVFAAVYFVVSLFPVLGFFNVFFFRYSFVSDHFQYLASMGPLVLIGAAIASGCERLTGKREVLRVGIAAGVLLISGSLAWTQTGIYRNLEALWRDTVARNPEAWIARMNLGALLASSGRPAEAIPHYEVALRLRPNDPLAQVNWGVALLQMNQISEAIQHLQLAVKWKPDLAEAHSTLGLALNSAGRKPEAIAEFETAVRLKPDSDLMRYNLGTALLQAGRTADALTQFEAAARLAPTAGYIQGAIGRALVALGRREEAVQHLSLATRLNPRDAEAWDLLADIVYQNGQNADALACANAALAIRPDMIACHLTAGNALLRLGRPAEAIPHFEVALHARPDDAALQSDIGTAWYQIGRPADAIPHYRTAVNLKPDSVAYRNNLGSALTQNGQPAEAVNEYEHALQLEPGNLDLRCNLALALNAAGRRDDAIRECREVLRHMPDNKQAGGLLEHLLSTR